MKAKIPPEICEHIMSYLATDVPHYKDKYFQFKEENQNIYVSYRLKMYVPRQVAGFGTSVAYIYTLEPGTYSKEEVVYQLLSKGYFGECTAKPEAEGWTKCGCLIVKLIRPGY